MRTTMSTATMEHHCQRERRSLSRRSVNTNKARGAIFMLSNEVARARKHATAKNPESSNSTSKACVPKIPPEDTRVRRRVRRVLLFFGADANEQFDPEKYPDDEAAQGSEPVQSDRRELRGAGMRLALW